MQGRQSQYELFVIMGVVEDMRLRCINSNFLPIESDAAHPYNNGSLSSSSNMAPYNLRRRRAKAYAIPVPSLDRRGFWQSKILSFVAWILVLRSISPDTL